MVVDTTPATATTADQKHCYLLGAVAAFLIAAGYVAIFPLYARVGVPPSEGQAWFSYLPGKTTAWWAILSISVVTDVLFLPVAMALYLALKDIGRCTMLAAAALMALFVVLDLAVTWSHYASILTLYQTYSTTADEVRRAACVAAADYASAVLTSRLEVVYAIMTLSLGILLAGTVMWKGRFGRITAGVGIATGVLGALAWTGLSAAIIGNALFATIWLFLIAFQFYRWARI